METGKAISRPLIVAIEGCDAAGKKTQATKLAEHYANGVYLTFPRYDGPFGQVLQRSLRRESVIYSRVPGRNGEQAKYEYNPSDDIIALRGLFLLDHYDGATKILELNKAGKLVVLDRYWPSNVCYGTEDGFDMKLLESVSSFMPPADIYFFIDVTVEIAVQRRPVPRDRYEKDLEKMARVRQRYIDLWHKNSEERTSGSIWIRIDGHATQEEVSTQLIHHIDSAQQTEFK